jgi:2',3'-cyclic-nucleotide 2'-phosphodiesterase (5'-nucleotidase family)
MKKLLILFALLFVALVGCDLSTTAETTATTQNTTNIQSTTEVTTTTTDITQTTQPSTILTTTTDSITTTTQPTTSSLPSRQNIHLYSINDFHGGAYADFESFSKVAQEIIDAKTTEDIVIALGNGDIFQGSAISNYYYGRPLIEAMNIAEFDGFVIGNHEFDWGIEKIVEYNDDSTDNGEADFPFLAANIVYEDTQEPLSFTQPYITIEEYGVKIGVIGVIGDVINSISASRVENIEFLDPVTVIADYAQILRTEQDIDIVVVYIHNGSDINYDIAALTGNQRVDAVFNGHTHQDEAGSISRGEDYYPLLFAQSRSNSDSILSEINLVYDFAEEKVIFGEANTLSLNDLSGSNANVDQLFDEYLTDAEYLQYVNQVLTTAEYNFYRSNLAPWGASVIKDYLGIDVGAVNSGGFRVTMEQGEVTMGDLVVIYPFDNVIKTTDLTGQQLLDFYEEVQYYDDDVVFDQGLTYDGTNLYIDGNLVIMDQYYTVGAVDYIFDKAEYDFLDGINITYTGYFMRDLLAEDLGNTIGFFNPINGTSYVEPLSYFYKQTFISI